MFKKFASVFLVLLVSVSYSQHSEITDKWQKEEIEIDNDKIIYHLYNYELDKEKPLILYLEGSGNKPLYYLNPNGRYSTSLTLNLKAVSEKFHIAVVNKPATPLVDTIKIASSGRKFYPLKEEFKEKYSLTWRVKAANLALQDIVKNFRINEEKIVIWGHSEGAQVAPALAVENEKITHVIAMMGNSLNHLYDFIITQRIAFIKGKKSATEAHSVIDSLYSEFEKIYEKPNSVNDEWFGETYYKWSSFSLNSPLENMLKLNIPILYIAGGEDANQNIINMDYAKLEFLRNGKKNLTYKVFPEIDHFFMETTKDKEGKTQWIDHLDEVNEFALNWLDRSN